LLLQRRKNKGRRGGCEEREMSLAGVNGEAIFSRTRELIGAAGVERLRRSRVAVFGLGGVGSFALEGLARAGIGFFQLVDHDVIEPSNLNRQLLALYSTLGLPKVAVARQRVKDINPAAEVITCQVRCSEENCAQLLEGNFDYVVDAIDMVPAKIALVAAAFRRGIPVVSSMGAGNKMDPLAFRVGDIAETRVCPLARAVRRGLRQQGIESGVKAVYSVEPVRKRAEYAEKAGQAEEAAGSGYPPASISFTPAVAGMLLAATVVRDLLADLITPEVGN